MNNNSFLFQSYDISQVKNVYGSDDAPTPLYFVFDTEKYDVLPSGNRVVCAKALVFACWIQYTNKEDLATLHYLYPSPRYEIHQGDFTDGLTAVTLA